MPRTIYDKSTRALLKDMLADFNLQPGQVLTTSRVLDWFANHYPKLQPNSLKAHLVQSSTNDRSRLHHPSTTEKVDLLFKLAPGQFRLYEPGKDPAPIHELVEGDVAREEELEREREADQEADSEEFSGSSEFLLERDLQRYLSENLSVVEQGLKIYEEEGIRGLEYEAGGGRRIDILAVDKSGDLVVLELKVSRGYDRVVGQLLRYMNWVRQNLADSDKRVRGMIVCRNITDDLRLACASIPEVELFEYKLSVAVSKIPSLGLSGSR